MLIVLFFTGGVQASPTYSPNDVFAGVAYANMTADRILASKNINDIQIPRSMERAAKPMDVTPHTGKTPSDVYREMNHIAYILDRLMGILQTTTGTFFMLDNLNIFNTIRKKILASNGVLLVILLLVLLLVLLFALTQPHTNQQLLGDEEEAIAALTEIAEIKERFFDFRLAATEFIVLLQNQSKERRDTGYQQLQTLFAETTHAEINSLAPELDRYYKQSKMAAPAFINDDRMQGSVLLNQSTQTSSSTLDTLKALYKDHQRNVNNIAVSVHESNNRVSFSLYSLLVVMIIAGIGGSLFMANLISRALQSLQNTVEHIERSGDLTQRADIQSNDEVGSLAAAFNRLVDSLATIVREVMRQSREKTESTVKRAGESLDAITRSVANILNMNTQIASAAEQQASTTEEIIRNIDNIQSIAEQTASGAEQTAGASNELSHLGDHLRTLVGRFKV